MKLVVGLGNPGRKYEHTRHNVGFAVLELLAQQWGTPPSPPLTRSTGCPRGGDRRRQFQGETLEIDLAGERTLLLWPHTYMNKSGASVLAARDFFKIPLEELLVICDDFNLLLPRLRFRPSGSAGGQKGLQDIIRCLGTEEFGRLRIGIGPVPPHFDPADFVLGRLTRQEQGILEPTLHHATQAVRDWTKEGMQACMNKYNAAGEKKEEKKSREKEDKKQQTNDEIRNPNDEGSPKSE